jgi:cytochrome c553
MNRRRIWRFASPALLAGTFILGVGLLAAARAKDLPPEAGPDIVILRELENTYDPVPFEHKSHAKMAQMWNGCVTCHHRSPQLGAGAAPPAPGRATQEASAQIPACKSATRFRLPMRGSTCQASRARITANASTAIRNGCTRTPV